MKQTAGFGATFGAVADASEADGSGGEGAAFAAAAAA
eukprot:CAMPEP_0181335478 /NCGR_PEP_ID=MMETSP1101-20121128/26852_1 /TAXON_ID=46948 /ORGANISM="Rhodomonas abbreviata, Strain Caron Lab Isolate" /LENGTH=36 /DNA_ID= /DNA_START= /DNA_END= /DNA_ORIENTATION=